MNDFLVVIITRIIAGFYVTKRYIRLEKEFKHRHGVREEAMKHPDREKGRALACHLSYFIIYTFCSIKKGL